MRVSTPTPSKTFRDPAGSLSIHEDVVLRRVHSASCEEARALLASSFYRQAVERGDVVASNIREDDGDTLLLEHPRVLFVSYPWEWSPAQWVAAGELTLRLCEEALAEGWILKDATPLNVLFEGAKPVFVDVLSFERCAPRSTLWTAQAQFVRTFLLQLIAHTYLGWPLAAASVRRDGLSPADLLPYLPKSAWLRPLLLANIALPGWLEKRVTVSEEKVQAAKAREADPEIASALLRRTLRSLGKQLRKAAGRAGDSHWRSYQGNLAHYAPADQQEKQRFVAECLAACSPRTVLDVGTNTGTYAMLAARAGARVLAIDTDEASADQVVRTARAEGADIQPLVLNLARPTPAVGWDCNEQLSFVARVEGRIEFVLMLAVIHHLLLTEQIPLEHIASLCSRLATRYLLVEWVPTHDPMYRQLLRGRGALYGHLTQEHLLAAMSPHFRVERQQPLTNGRVLFLFERLP